MNGALYIVATPIGNLEDITHRAVRVLGEVDLIACEDTRQTRKLLEHYAIAKPLVSYHDHNEQARAEELLRELQAGKSVALVSDAGTPLIADPGYRLVEKAREHGIQVSPIPGPSALVAALSASGLPTDSFCFHGFLPGKHGARVKILEQLRDSESTHVFYEAPHRILDALQDVEETLGSRPLVLAREVTKLHEEFLSGTAGDIREALAARPSVKGEITLMIGKGAAAAPSTESLEDAVERLIHAGMPRMEALKTVARERGLGKREVYKKLNER